MLFKTFIDLANSPLGEENEDLEKIILELDIQVGTTKIGIREIKKILSLVHKVYHTLKDCKEKPIEVAMTYLNKQVGKSWVNHIMSIWRTITPGLVPTSSVTSPKVSQPQTLSLPTISDLPNFSYPSDIIIKNVFRIMFETDVWDYLVLDDRLERHVFCLKTNASSRTMKTSDDPAERWRKHYDHRMGELLEIWSEMLDKILEKKSKLKDKKIGVD